MFGFLVPTVLYYHKVKKAMSGRATAPPTVQHANSTPIPRNPTLQLPHHESIHHIQENTTRTTNPTELSHHQLAHQHPNSSSLLIQPPKYNTTFLLGEFNTETPPKPQQIQKSIQTTIKGMESSNVLHLHIPAHWLDVYTDDCSQKQT